MGEGGGGGAAPPPLGPEVGHDLTPRKMGRAVCWNPWSLPTMSAAGPAERLSRYTREADLGYPEGGRLNGPQFAGREHALNTQLARMKTTVEHLQQMVQRQDLISTTRSSTRPFSQGERRRRARRRRGCRRGAAPWVSDPC